MKTKEIAKALGASKVIRLSQKKNDGGPLDWLRRQQNVKKIRESSGDKKL